MLMLGVGALALLYVFFAASTKPVQREGYARFAQGEMRNLDVMEAPPPMPVQPLQDAQGAETSLAAYQGEVIVLNLWATWCAPCVEEMPTLGALQRQFEGRLVVVPVSVDSVAERDHAKAELARLSEASLPFLTDSSRAILFATVSGGMPTTIIYNREGREIARLVGGADWSSPEATAFFEAVLNDSK